VDFLPTRQPLASCFNFFPTAQKILKFSRQPTLAHLPLPPNLTSQRKGKGKRANFANALFFNSDIHDIFFNKMTDVIRQ